MSFANPPAATCTADTSNVWAATSQSFGLPFLPPDLLIKILGMLPIQQLGSLNQTCWQMYFVTRDNRLTLLLDQHFPNFRKSDPHQTDLEALKEQHFTNANVLKGLYACQTLETHESNVSTYDLDGRRLVSASSEGTIKIWDLITNTCTATLQSHSGPVDSLALKGQKLFSISFDNTIKIWDLSTNKCTATLQSRDNTLSILAIDEHRLFLSTNDNNIEIWDLNSNTCTATLEGHDDTVNQLVIEGEKLVSGSFDGTIKIWDLSTNKCSATLQEHSDSANSFTLNGNTLISGSSDKTIKIWDLNTNTCTATLEGHKGTVNSLVLKGKILISASSDKTIKIWDLSTNRCSATLFEHKSIVDSLVLDAQSLISYSSESGVIKKWDFNVSDEVILREIANLLQSDDTAIVENALVRFDRMPSKAKDAIYDELSNIMPFKNIDGFRNDCAENAFLNRNGMSSSAEQKRQAILNYLQMRS
ncbi:MAG: F-box/WD repeat-containing protein [Verrucomicrobia bacterium]|nr:F-box/WD repeat-containing protein [Verrucomicrobiota bacterium]